MITHLRLVSVYFAAQLWPALLSLGTMLGAALPYERVPGIGPENTWLMNLIAWIAVLNLIAAFVLLLKKLFGRQPPLDEILAGLVRTQEFDGYKEEQRLRCVGLEKQISDARHQFDERCNADLVRQEKAFNDIFARGAERDRMIEVLRDSIARLHERTETHIRKFDHIEGRIERMLERVSRTVFEMEKKPRQ